MSKLLNLGFDAIAVIVDDEQARNLLPKIRTWIDNDSEHVPKTLTDAQIIQFILACEYVEVNIQNCITEYYTLRKKTPELFANRDFNSEIIQRQFEIYDIFISSELTDEGYVVLFTRYKPNGVKNYDMEASLKLFTMISDLVIYKFPSKGAICLQDASEMSLGYFFKLRLGIFRKYMHYTEHAIPLKIKTLHIVNTNRYFYQMISLVKRMISTEMMNLMNVHPSNLNMEEFYEKYVPRRCLPKDFGGDQPSFEEMNLKLFEELKNFNPYFKEEEQQRND